MKIVVVEVVLRTLKMYRYFVRGNQVGIQCLHFKTIDREKERDKGTNYANRTLIVREKLFYNRVMEKGNNLSLNILIHLKEQNSMDNSQNFKAEQLRYYLLLL